MHNGISSRALSWATSPIQDEEEAKKLQVKMEELKKQEEDFRKKEEEIAKKERVSNKMKTTDTKADMKTTWQVQ